MSIGLDVSICDGVGCDNFVVSNDRRNQFRVAAGCRLNVNKKGLMIYGTGVIPKDCPYKSIHIIKSNVRVKRVVIRERTV